MLTVPYLRGNLKTPNGLKSNLIPVTFLQRQLETRDCMVNQWRYYHYHAPVVNITNVCGACVFRMEWETSYSRAYWIVYQMQTCKLSLTA